MSVSIPAAVGARVGTSASAAVRARETHTIAADHVVVRVAVNPLRAPVEPQLAPLRASLLPTPQGRRRTPGTDHAKRRVPPRSLPGCVRRSPAAHDRSSFRRANGVSCRIHGGIARLASPRGRAFPSYVANMKGSAQALTDSRVTSPRATACQSASTSARLGGVGMVTRRLSAHAPTSARRRTDQPRSTRVVGLEASSGQTLKRNSTTSPSDMM